MTLSDQELSGLGRDQLIEVIKQNEEDKAVIFRHIAVRLDSLEVTVKILMNKVNSLQRRKV